MADIEVVVENGRIYLEIGSAGLSATRAVTAAAEAEQDAQRARDAADEAVAAQEAIGDSVAQAQAAAEAAETAQGHAETAQEAAETAEDGAVAAAGEVAADAAAADADAAAAATAKTDAEAAAAAATAAASGLNAQLQAVAHVADEFTTDGVIGNTIKLATGTAIDSATKTLAFAYPYSGRVLRVFNYNGQATGGTLRLKQVDVDIVGATGTVSRSDDVAIPVGSTPAGVLLATPIPFSAGQHPGFYNFNVTGRTSYVLNGPLVVPHWSIAGDKMPADGAWALGTMVDTRALMFGLEVEYDNGEIEIITAASINGRIVYHGKQGAVAMTGSADTNFSGYKSINEPFRHHGILLDVDVSVETAGVISLGVWRRADDGKGWTFRARFSKDCATTGTHTITAPANLEVVPGLDHLWIVGTTGSGKISRQTSTTDAQTWGVYSTIPFSAGVVGVVQSTVTTGDVAFEVRARVQVIDEVEPDGIMYQTRFAAGTFPFDYASASTLHVVSVGKVTLGEEGMNKAFRGRRSQAFNRPTIRGRIRTPNLLNVFGLVPYSDGYGSLMGIDVENDQLHFYTAVTGSNSPTLPSIRTTINNPFPTPLTDATIVEAIGSRDDRVMLWRVYDDLGNMASDGTAAALEFDATVVEDMTAWPTGDATFAAHFDYYGQFVGAPFFGAPTGKGTGGELLECTLTINGGDEELGITSDSMMQSRKSRNLAIGYALVDHAHGGAVMIGRDGMNSSGARRLLRDSWWVTPRMKTLTMAQGMVDITGGTSAAQVYAHQLHTVDAMLDTGMNIVWASPAPTFDTDPNQEAQQELAALIRAGALGYSRDRVRYCPWNERFRTAGATPATQHRLDQYFFGYPSVFTDAHWAEPGDERALSTLVAAAGDWIKMPPAAKFWH